MVKKVFKRSSIIARKRKVAEDVQEIMSDEDSDFDIPETVEEKKVVIEASESSDDEGHDSDKELQVALREGLLKSDKLNYIVEKQRPIINKKEEILEKISGFSKKLPWIETLDITTSNSITKEMIPDDFEREMQFYKQAEKAVQIAVPRLLAMNVKVLRPTDYYAEMAKTDGHMQRVRKRLLKIQEGKERQEAVRRMRDEKKYATKVQKQAIENKNSEKKKLMEAVKKHKKGMKQQLEDMLNNVKKMELDKDDDDEGPRGRKPEFGRNSGRSSRDKNFKTEYKSKKFGYGGKKKGMKRNDKSSFDDIGDRGKFRKSGGPGRRR